MLFIILSVFVLWLLHYYGTRNFDYWKKRGVTCVKNPLPFLGNNARQFLLRCSMADSAAGVYRDFPDEKVVGCFAGNIPTLLIRDPQLVKQMLVTDFHYFYPRGLNLCPDAIEPMLKNLFFADGDLWKLLRQRMTPVFTSGKLKAMFPLIVETTEKLQRIATEAAEIGKEIDIRDVMARYTTDFIGACGFGIDSNSLSDEDSTFRKLGKRIFTRNLRDAVVFTLKVAMPRLFKNFTFLVPEVEQTTVSLVKSIMSQRNYKPCGRNDFIDLILELKDKDAIIGESIEKRDKDGKPEIVQIELDEILIAAQVFIFFVAGFETSSSATSYTLHQLAFHPEVQRRCQEEIDDILAKYNGKLCYDAVKEMRYLEMTFRESMRLFPSLGFLSRKCAKPYQIPGTDILLDESAFIFIAVQAMHNDEKYFENPQCFIPERFDPESGHDYKDVYIPFGMGPRACIGERLGLMQSIAGLAALLHKFSVVPSENTKRHPTSDPCALIVQSIQGGLPLKLIARS